MGEKAEPKISLPEIVFIGIFLGVLDLIDLIPAAGDITDVFAAPLLLYYVMKHINGIAYAAALILDAIPFTQEFPTRSLVWWGTVIFDHFAPKQLSSTVERIGELEEGGTGEDIGASAAEKSAHEAEETAAAVSKEERALHGGEDELRGEAGTGAEEEQAAEEDGDQTGQEEGGNGEIKLGSEVSPDEEAKTQDFGQTPEEDETDENDERSEKYSQAA